MRNNNAKTEVTYFNSTNIIRGRYWKVFLRKAVPVKWVQSLGNTCEGDSILVKFLAEAPQVCSILAPSQVRLMDFAKILRYFTASFEF